MYHRHHRNLNQIEYPSFHISLLALITVYILTLTISFYRPHRDLWHFFPYLHEFPKCIIYQLTSMREQKYHPVGLSELSLLSTTAFKCYFLPFTTLSLLSVSHSTVTHGFNQIMGNIVLLLIILLSMAISHHVLHATCKNSAMPGNVYVCRWAWLDCSVVVYVSRLLKFPNSMNRLLVQYSNGKLLPLWPYMKWSKNRFN